MIQSLPITLAQGLSLHSACIEVDKIEIDAFERRNISEVYVRESGELKQAKGDSEAEFETVVTGLRFSALAWVNVNTHQQGKPPFPLLTNDEKVMIEIDFEKYPQIADHFDNGFNPEATRSQRLEGTCEKYIRDVLVEALKA